jgi:hypothetical protein
MQWVWDVQKTKHDDHQQKQNFKVVSRPFYETLQYERPKSIVSKESGWKSQCKKKGEGAQKEKKKKITSTPRAPGTHPTRVDYTTND